jgi:hypothetical protein
VSQSGRPDLRALLEDIVKGMTSSIGSSEPNVNRQEFPPVVSQLLHRSRDWVK